jgi:hypothetical protein
LISTLQFEVLTKLTKHWRSRIDGCPDAAILEYCSSQPNQTNAVPEHLFEIVCGTLDKSANNELGLYHSLLVEDDDGADRNNDIPVEALFDDLSISGVMLPLSKSKWNTQHPTVQKKLFIADIRNITIQGQKTKVTLQTYGNPDATLVLQVGRQYRISPRLVDFNTTKLLSVLVELDFRCSEPEGRCPNVPFLKLISDPQSFAKTLGLRSVQKNNYLETENTIQAQFQKLHGLGSDSAGALVLKASQQQAAQSIMCNRLSVIWGPPGQHNSEI